MQPRCKLWLEHDDNIAMSDYRFRLLAAIHDTGSLSAAAQRLGLSYRRAWGKIRELEQNLDACLVESAAGGAGGGRSRLTAEGLDLLHRYDEFADQSRRAVAAIFDAVFTPAAGPTDPASVLSDRSGPR
ncbi:MAG: LysR family transcriptional regulator [Dehalococcoidia bacterium]